MRLTCVLTVSSLTTSGQLDVLPENIADWVEKLCLMGAGLAMQQTVERPDNIPLSPGEGLLVVVAYAVVPLLVALWLIGRRDA